MRLSNMFLSILGSVLLAVPSPAAPPSDPILFPSVASVPEAAPMPREKSDAPLCCGLEFVGQEVIPDLPKDGPKLGRAKPVKQYDYGAFRAVVGTDGVTRYFPRIGAHTDTSLRKAPPPDAVNYGAKAPNVIKKMYKNNQLGCCVISSRFHQFGIVNAVESGVEVFGTDNEVVSVYHSFCGAGDNGCNMSAVNQLQQTKGMTIAGVNRKIDGFASIDHTNIELTKTVITVFGGCNVGMSLPQAWYSSADGSDWASTNTRIVGGHEVQAFGYDEKGVWISTWAGTRRILWSAWTSTRWIDETYIALLPEWSSKDGVSAAGIDTAGLKRALDQVANGQVPVLPDPVVPPVVPPVTPPVTPPVVPPVTPPTGTGFTGYLTYSNGVLTGVSGTAPPVVTPPVVNPPVVTPPTPGAENPALDELKDRIAKHYARKNGAGLIVSAKELAAARAKLESEISDKALIQLAIEKGLPITKDGNKAGVLSDLFAWIVAHPAEIKAFIEFIISLFAIADLDKLPMNAYDSLQYFLCA